MEMSANETEGELQKCIDEARTLIHAARHATLGTLLQRNTQQNGKSALVESASPFVSLVNISPGLTQEAAEVDLLLSGLAVHTQNTKHSSLASLLLQDRSANSPNADILTNTRCTLIGRLVGTDQKTSNDWRKKYLGDHPSAVNYINFADFSAYRFTIDQIHLVAGFGRIETFDAFQLLQE